MKRVIGGKFILNGIVEKVIETPETRDGNIKITFGGHEDGFAESIPLTSFEEQTGYYIQGLEPEVKVPLQSLIDSFVNEALSNDFVPHLSDTPSILAAGRCRFSNHRAVNMSAWYIIRDNSKRGMFKGKDAFTINVCKNDGSKTINLTYDARHLIELDDKLKEAINKLKSFVVNKVQVLNSGKLDDSVERQYSQDGYPILKDGETLKDYFKQSKSPAGIVINAKGHYQVFTSYTGIHTQPTVTGRILHYESKSYKTIRGAIKFLSEHNFNEKGFLNDYINNDFAKDFRLEASRSMGVITSSDCWGEGLVRTHDCGTIFIHPVENTFVENFGHKASLKYVFTDEKTGQTYTDNVYISDSWRDNGMGFASNLHHIILRSEKALRNGEISFDVDNRTTAEKMEYHVDRVKYHEERANYCKERIKDYEDQAVSSCNYERFLNREREHLVSIIQLVDDHKLAYKKLKLTNDKELSI